MLVVAQRQAVLTFLRLTETFHLELLARNPLHATLLLADLEIRFSGLEDSPVDGVSIPKQEIELQPLSEQSVSLTSECSTHQLIAAQIRIPITCSANASFRITSVSYILNGTLKCTESLQRQGKRLSETKEHRLEPTYAQDKSLDVLVRDPIPRLDIDLTSLPTDLHAGETVTCDIAISNTSAVNVPDLHLITSHPNFVPVVGDSSGEFPLLTRRCNSFSRAAIYSHAEKQIDTMQVSSDLTPNTPSSIPITANTEKEQASPSTQSMSAPVVIRGDSAGVFTLSFMFLYRSSTSSSAYIPARRSHILHVHQSLDIRASIRPSVSASDPFAITVQVILIVKSTRLLLIPLAGRQQAHS